MCSNRPHLCKGLHSYDLMYEISFINIEVHIPSRTWDAKGNLPIKRDWDVSKFGDDWRAVLWIGRVCVLWEGWIKGSWTLSLDVLAVSFLRCLYLEISWITGTPTSCVQRLCDDDQNFIRTTIFEKGSLHPTVKKIFLNCDHFLITKFETLNKRITSAPQF